MNNTLPPSRIRSLQEASFSHQKISTLFMGNSLAPGGQLTAPMSRLATDGTFSHQEHLPRLIK